jgi:hypothetical protein
VAYRVDVGVRGWELIVSIEDPNTSRTRGGRLGRYDFYSAGYLMEASLTPDVIFPAQVTASMSKLLGTRIA